MCKMQLGFSCEVPRKILVLRWYKIITEIHFESGFQCLLNFVFSYSECLMEHWMQSSRWSAWLHCSSLCIVFKIVHQTLIVLLRKYTLAVNEVSIQSNHHKYLSRNWLLCSIFCFYFAANISDIPITFSCINVTGNKSISYISRYNLIGFCDMCPGIPGDPDIYMEISVDCRLC